MRNSDRPNLKRKMQERADEADEARKHLKLQADQAYTALKAELAKLAKQVTKYRAKLSELEVKQAECEMKMQALEAEGLGGLNKDELLDLLREERDGLAQLKDDKHNQEQIVKTNEELIADAYAQALAEDQCAQPITWCESVCISQAQDELEKGKKTHVVKSAEVKAKVAIAATKLETFDITGSLEALFNSQDTLFNWSQQESQPSGSQLDSQEEQASSLLKG